MSGRNLVVFRRKLLEMRATAVNNLRALTEIVVGSRAMLTFDESVAERGRLDEMTGRRSFQHTMGKFEPRRWKSRSPFLPHGGARFWTRLTNRTQNLERRRLNDEANRGLAANIQNRGLSHYPVVGAGQEVDDDGTPTVNKENSLVVQPVGTMSDDDFIAQIQELLFNPAGDPGHGPFQHTQWGALVKFPSDSPKLYPALLRNRTADETCGL